MAGEQHHHVSGPWETRETEAANRSEPLLVARLPLSTVASVWSDAYLVTPISKMECPTYKGEALLPQRSQSAALHSVDQKHSRKPSDLSRFCCTLLWRKQCVRRMSQESSKRLSQTPKYVESYRLFGVITEPLFLGQKFI